jgi:hypothetical protein
MTENAYKVENARAEILPVACGAHDVDRTHDLSLTKGVLYH